MKTLKELIIREDNTNGVIVSNDGGLAVAQFFYQRGADGKISYDARKLAEDFIKCQERTEFKPTPLKAG